ncbi:tau 95 subunit of transcription factor TFIIIC [Saxophila tyrrhenica]|uniref:Tau 95 subunit of transcription factor TFIIIC n=1 Tax=Saxophila tyrrhenica TaxID=1690608 RepID=A0AAV9P1T4_9PEZI|nr:tau 95 subunit of transcription factor TFIIIC [Saxophila tyrrhenica]
MEDSTSTSQVPPTQIVSIEHPCIIKNFHNGFNSLGGEQQLKHVLENDIGDSKDPDIKGGVEPEAGVSLRPNDPFAKKLASDGVHTGNVLVKVTVPKTTGRKRKRGSDVPYQESYGNRGMAPESITAPDLLRRMQDNPQSYTMEAVGVITDTHRFKSLPDFQLRADDVPIMHELRDHAMTPDYERLKAFDPVAGQNTVNPILQTTSTPTPLPGPPSFLHTSRPYARYPPPKPAQPMPPTQAPQKVQKKRGPKPKPKIPRATKEPAPQLRDMLVHHALAAYPVGPSTALTPRSELGSTISTIIDQLTTAMQTRPIHARLAYQSLLRGHKDANIRFALPHVGFYLDGGPWKNTIVKYGLDPRRDPKYRIYQTVSFSKTAYAAIRGGSAYGSPDKLDRVFDGTRVVDPAEMWQLCDFTQPLLQRLVHDSPVRPVCHRRYGWYYNGTIAKILVIVRDMMVQLSNPGRYGNLTDKDYEVLLKLPDQVEEAMECHLEHWHGEHLVRLAEAIGAEAVSATYQGIRGYEEQFPVMERKREGAAEGAWRKMGGRGMGLKGGGANAAGRASVGSLGGAEDGVAARGADESTTGEAAVDGGEADVDAEGEGADHNDPTSRDHEPNDDDNEPDERGANLDDEPLTDISDVGEAADGDDEARKEDVGGEDAELDGGIDGDEEADHDEGVDEEGADLQDEPLTDISDVEDAGGEGQSTAAEESTHRPGINADPAA